MFTKATADATDVYLMVQMKKRRQIIKSIHSRLLQRERALVLTHPRASPKEFHLTWMDW